MNHSDTVMQDQQRSAAQLTCPYMDSINRHILDFDFEKLCSVSNVKLNV
jgi:U4/U6.U5 tri-snRNP-associated protein 2